MTEQQLDQVTWWELPVPDAERAKAFYGAVFDWTFQSFGGHEMASTKDGRLVGALDGSTQEPIGRGVFVYVNVADLEITLARVATAGGEVVQERTEVGGDMGWWASFRDPDGLWLGLCTGNPAKDG